MEFANHWPPAEATILQSAGNVRVATADDAAAISRLLRTAEGSHIHLDWRLPVDWLGSPGFVVLPAPPENGRSVSRFITPQKRLLACLAATADPPPAAWVRVAAIAQAQATPAYLEAMLDVVEAQLRATAVTRLGWLVGLGQEWPNRWLPGLGFELTNQIETYLKDDLDLPPFQLPPNLIIRPAQQPDFAALAQMETAAFAPLWRLSAATLALASQEALCFDVAEWHGRLVGYQLSTGAAYSAHLVRLVIAQDVQGQGVGSALLASAIQSYGRHGLRRVTLNTQIDNQSSQRLYQKFGFQATGERLPVWSKGF